MTKFNQQLMRGAPVPATDQVTLANWRQPPFNRWAFSHVTEILPNAIVANDPARIVPLASGPALNLDKIPCPGTGGAPGTISGMLAETFTDGFLVLHKGRIVAEHYAAALDPLRPHIIFSVSKSITGTLAGILVQGGELLPDAPVIRYVPEVAGSAYADATVRHVLDMTVAIDFREDYLDPDGDFMQYRRACGWNPAGDPATASDLRSFLARTRRGTGEHGSRFSYVSPNSDLLGWILERASGRRLADLLSDGIWRHIGAETPAYITVDRLGAPRSAGGISVTLRDLARFGDMMRLHGMANGHRVVPAAWVDDILENGDRSAWLRGDFINLLPDGRYRNKWYIVDATRESFCAIGIHGQWIFIDRRHDVVMVKVSSQPLPVDDQMDHQVLAGFRAISAEIA